MVTKKECELVVKLYNVYNSMIARCRTKNPDSLCYKSYYRKNIIVCNEWKNDFYSFYTWAISNGYEHGLTIDRINNSGNYCPENCRWVDRRTQANNRDKRIDNADITYNGETHSIREWSTILNIPQVTLYTRRRRGFTPEQILFGKRIK